MGVEWIGGMAIAAALFLSGDAQAAVALPRVEPRPWSAPASVLVAEEAVSISTTGARLAGTLYLPARRAPVAAVVVVHGASSPLRSSPLYMHLKTILPSLGIAVLVYDRRGEGESTGNPSSGEFPVLAGDAIAAIARLKQDPRIDSKRIGIWGLSQGGWLSLLAASQSPNVAFAVSISAPVVTPDVQMMFSSTNTLRVFGFSQADIEEMRSARKAVDDYMRGTGTQERAQALVTAASGKPWFKYLYMSKTIGRRETSGWAREIALDPISLLDRVKAPTLMLYGADDPVVPVETSIERLAATAPGHPGIEVKVIAGADHGMQMSVDPRDLLDPTKADEERPDSLEYFATLASWLTKIGVTTD